MHNGNGPYRPSGHKMESLFDAAKSVTETARKERLPLAVVAEREGDVLGFFARNIARVVGVWRKKDGGDYEPAKGDGDPQSLYIRPGDIESYLRWARTVK